MVLQAKMLGLANGKPGEADSAAGFLAQVNTHRSFLFASFFDRLQHLTPAIVNVEVG